MIIQVKGLGGICKDSNSDIPSNPADILSCNVKKILFPLWNVNPENTLHKNRVVFHLYAIETFCPVVIN